jgi:hypothetical protein
MDASHVAGTLAYLAVNAGLMLLGAALLRRAFTVFGAVGVVGFGVWWSRNEARLSSRLQAVLPAGLREAIASRRPVL